MGNEKNDSDGIEVTNEGGRERTEFSTNCGEVNQEPVQEQKVLPMKHPYDLRRPSRKSFLETSSRRNGGGGRRQEKIDSEGKGTLLTCKTCDEAFQSRRALQKHMYSHKVRMHRCHSCPKYYASKRGLLDHLVSAHGEEEQEAPTGVNRAEVNSSSKTTDGTRKKYVCSYCPRSYNNSSRLRAHLISHTSESTKCTICQRVMADRRGLIVHMGTHGPRSKLRCHLCPNGYLSRQGLRIHLVRDHNLKMKDARKTVVEQARTPHGVCDQVADSAGGTIPTTIKSCRSTTVSQSRKKRSKVKKLRQGVNRELEDGRTTRPDLKSIFLSALDLRPSNTSDVNEKRKDGIEVAASVNVLHSISVRSTRSAAKKSKDATPISKEQSAWPNSTKYTCAVCRRRFYTLSKLGCHMCKRMKIERVSPASTKSKTTESVNSRTSPSSSSPPKSSAVEEVIDPREEETMQSGTKMHPKLTRCTIADKKKDVGRENVRNERRNFCDECSKQFPRPTSLAIHILRSHGGRISRLCCSLCGRKFWTRNELHLHLKMSHKVKPKIIQTMGQKKSALPSSSSSASVHEYEADRPNSKIVVQPGSANSAVSSLDCGIEDLTSSSADTRPAVKPQEATTSARHPRPCSHSCGRNTDDINRSENSGLSRCQRTNMGLMPAHYQVAGGGGMNTELMTCISHIAQAVQILPSIIAGGFQGTHSNTLVAHTSSTTARRVPNNFHSSVANARSRPMSPVWEGNNEDEMKPVPTVIDLTDGKSSTEQPEDSMNVNEENHCENCNFCKYRSF